MDPELFKALAEPTRAKLLGCLIKCGRPCSVTEIAECCAIDFSVVARHLTMMARSGVLDSQKEGRTVWYTARSAELAERFRAIADAIEEWKSNECCGQDGSC
jgi:DNA-binding transcriptional ArsR family regulator